MAVSISDFWKLLVDAELLSTEQCDEFVESFSQVKGASTQGNAKTLSEWLISQNVISRYQAKVLLAGRAGPFVYGDFSIYDLFDEIALDGVYKAVHLPTRHAVALRFLGGPSSGFPVSWQRITQLAKIASAIRHVHLLRFFELVDLGRFKFLVFEDLRGQSLAKQIKANGPLPPAESCRLVRQAAVGLSQLHMSGRLHGSISPAHLWRLPCGNLKLIHDPLTVPSPIHFADHDTGERLKRQADYLAPEMVRHGQTPVQQGDIYSLGCVLYHLLSGKPPFPGGNVQQKISRHTTESPVALDQIGVPPALSRCVAYMMAKNPESRYAQAAAVAEALGAFVDPAQIGVPSQQEPATTAAYERYIAARPAPVASSQAAPRPTSPASVAVEWTTAPLINVDRVSPSDVAARAYSDDAATTSQSSGDSSTETESKNSPSRTHNRSRNMAFIAGGAGLALLVVILAVIGAFYAFSNGHNSASTAQNKKLASTKRPAHDGDPNQTPLVTVGPGAQKTRSTLNGREAPGGAIRATNNGNRPREEPIDDDGETFWASPTWGPPLDLGYVAIGAQAFLILRPAELLADPNGALMVEALGPGGHDARVRIEQRLGIGFDAMEQLVIAFYPADDQPTQTLYVVRLKESKTADTLATGWQEASPASFGGAKIYANETWAYYMPASENGMLLAVGSIENIKEIVGQQGRQPVLGQLERLLRTTDTDRHVTLLVSPQFLFGDGRSVFAGAADRLRAPLDDFIGDGVRALSLSLHLDDRNAFAELRVLGILERKPIDLATDYNRRLHELRERVEDYLASIAISPHSRKLLNRFPSMLGELALNTRFETEDDQAVLRCYVYAPGSWNIVKATELALHETGGVVGAHVAPPPSPKPKTIEEKLKQQISLRIPIDTLEKTIEIWAGEIGVVAKILGGDLQLEGITKNQSFHLDERDQSAESVLRTILSKASPDGKLVYIIKPEQPGGDPIVMITTIAAATKRGDKLPSGFEKN